MSLDLDLGNSNILAGERKREWYHNFTCFPLHPGWKETCCLQHNLAKLSSSPGFVHFYACYEESLPLAPWQHSLVKRHNWLSFNSDKYQRHLMDTYVILINWFIFSWNVVYSSFFFRQTTEALSVLSLAPDTTPRVHLFISAKCALSHRCKGLVFQLCC